MTNPLTKYFRQPAIYIQLPSKGRFYANGSLKLPANSELPVLPMTAIDEITYRTPDALFNGTAVVDVIKSCLPNIIDPWKIPGIDLDAILIGIRIASYGHTMDIETSCPYCQHENAYELDLRTVLDQIKAPDYNQPLKVGGVEIFFRPLSYDSINKNNLQQFEEQRLIQAIPTMDGLTDEEKMGKLKEALGAVSKLSLAAISESIEYIKAGDDRVDSIEYISEYIANIDKDSYKKIRDRVISFREQSDIKPLTIVCQNQECKKTYETPFTLDVSNFFE